MSNKDNSAPCGAPLNARLDGSSAADGGTHASAAKAIPPRSARTKTFAVRKPDERSPAEILRSLTAPNKLGGLPLATAEAFFQRIAETAALDERASLLQWARIKPYDECTRDLVRSVAEEGPVGALVQHLLHDPEPMPGSIV